MLPKDHQYAHAGQAATPQRRSDRWVRWNGMPPRRMLLRR